MISISPLRRFLKAIGPSKVVRRNPESGANLVEYMLLVSLIAVLCIAAVSSYRQTNTDIFLNIAYQLTH